MGKRGIQRGAFITSIVTPLVVISGGMIHADAINCSIYNTGTDSYNACIAQTHNKTYVTCVNDVYTVYSTSQNASSGNAGTSGNTNGGTATSGSAVNANGTSVQIGATCNTAPVTTTGGGTTTTPTTPPKTTTPPKSTATKTIATVKTKPTAAVLPDTGSSNIAQITLMGIAGLAAVYALSKIGIAVFQRVTLK